MSSQPAREILHDIDVWQRAARRPRTEVWFPLFVFGSIEIPGMFLAVIIGREHLGSYYLPASLAGGLLCAWHYRRAGRTSGLQAPALIWLIVIVALTCVAAVCSGTGREHGWDLLNLAGPGIALTAGYAILAIWARSTDLLVVVGVMALSIPVTLSFARGNEAISIYVAVFAIAALSVGTMNWRRQAQ